MASGPLHEYIGKFGLGRGAEDIMSGNCNGDKAEDLPAVNHWLKHHIRRCNTTPIKVTLSQQEYTDLFRNQNKSTSSSPSGRHYSHYRAALSSKRISNVHRIMMILPFQH
eukprot:15355349-Ditylum_brightwellii.AAC.1